MVSPAQPAQPAQPVTPEDLATRQGGYTGPSSRTANYVPTPIPGGSPGSPPQGTPSPAPAPAAPGPSGAPTAPTGAPGGFGALGVDQQGYEAIIGELKESKDPKVFKKQFETLMSQRELIARPDGLDAQGNYVLSSKQKTYYSKKLNEAISYAQAPVEAGGLGYSPNEAKMKAIIEARRQWPKVPVWAYASKEALGGFADPEVKVGEKEVTVGPRAAANLKPARIAEILTDKGFKTAYDQAQEFIQEKPNASAKDFMEHVIDSEIAKRMTAQSNGVNDPKVVEQATGLGIPIGEDGKVSVEEIEKAAAQLRLQQKQWELEGNPAADQAKQTVGVMDALEEVIRLGREEKSEKAVREEVHSWFLDNAETLSVVAALNQLY